MDEVLKKTLSAAREADSRQAVIFLCKNLSRYPIVHGSKRTLLYSGAFRLYVPQRRSHIQVKGAIQHIKSMMRVLEFLSI